MSIRVTVWHEYRHEKKNPEIAKIYPDGMHEVLAAGLREHEGLEVRTAWLDQPEAGLTDEILQSTDVLTWWGHMAHGDVPDAVVEKVFNRVVRDGMGLIALHSGHFSKIFRRLMGTSCDLKWRVGQNEREVLWVTRPGHPILQGIDDHFVLPEEEMYGEFFDIPEPEQTILISSFGGGEVFRSGCCWHRGAGKVFYFRPGHETFRSYYDPNVRRVIANACRWATPTPPPTPHTFGNRKAGWIEGEEIVAIRGK